MTGKPLETCFYEGTVHHRRWTPSEHEFSFRLFMVWLDLGELDQVFGRRGWWSARWPAFARFRRADYLGRDSASLADSVRELVQQQLGFRPEGAIRLLTNLRYAGFAMNPLSLYYCYANEGDKLQAIVAEVSNTPWNERHHYVLDLRSPDQDGSFERSHRKEFHVSPFMPMEMDYHWRITTPAERLTVQLQNWQQDQLVFDARLCLTRQPFTPRNKLRCLIRYPLQTWRIFAVIYWQAWQLWRKGVPPHPHPKHRPLPPNAPQPPPAAESLVTEEISIS